MPYIIDGHNLIPKIQGLSLQAMDDEIQLIELLQEYCRRARKEVEVYFDNAPAGQPKARNYGQVVARFTRQGMTADDAIRGRLDRLGNEARNWIVVSSDHGVQSSARARRAKTLSSEAFAAQMRAALQADPGDPGAKPDAAISGDEMDDWLELFGGEEGESLK